MKNYKSRLNWTEEEDIAIKKFYEQDKIQSWKKISKELRKKKLQKKRTAKQCRQRYINYIKYQTKTEIVIINEWTREQERILFDKFLEYGSKWIKIAPFLPAKSENKIKNKFYGSLRKLLRKINQVEKQIGPKSRKQLKYQSLLKFFQIMNLQNQACYSEKLGKKFNMFLQLKIQLVKIIYNFTDQQTNQQKFMQIANSLHEFNSSSRFLSRMKNKSHSLYGANNQINIQYLNSQQKETEVRKETFSDKQEIKNSDSQEQQDDQEDEGEGEGEGQGQGEEEEEGEIIERSYMQIFGERSELKSSGDELINVFEQENKWINDGIDILNEQYDPFWPFF